MLILYTVNVVQCINFHAVIGSVIQTFLAMECLHHSTIHVKLTANNNKAGCHWDSSDHWLFLA